MASLRGPISLKTPKRPCKLDFSKLDTYNYSPSKCDAAKRKWEQYKRAPPSSYLDESISSVSTPEWLSCYSSGGEENEDDSNCLDICKKPRLTQPSTIPRTSGTLTKVFFDDVYILLQLRLANFSQMSFASLPVEIKVTVCSFVQLRLRQLEVALDTQSLDAKLDHHVHWFQTLYYSLHPSIPIRASLKQSIQHVEMWDQLAEQYFNLSV